jgi:L-asparaginase II
MSNPVLINLTRGSLVESFHRGAICIIRADGDPVIALGDIDRPIYPRSAIKVLQALPLIESGAADAAGLTDKELALACSSHNGEVVHVETARAVLAKSGIDEEALACGSQWPMRVETAHELAAQGHEPTSLHNNCSGKHAGMLTLANHLEAGVDGYEHVDHQVQQRILQAIEEMTGEASSPELCGIDGCSVPTWAMPLRGLARAFARLASLSGLSAEREMAAKRLMHACMSEPMMVEGTGRFGTGVMTRLGASAFMKGGAEGVYCAAFPEHGMGMALKMDDGAKRGSESAAAHLVASLFSDRIEHASDIYEMELTNWKGLKVGEILPTEELVEAISCLRS